MSAYVQVDSRVIKTCEQFKIGDVSLAKFAWIAYEASGEICSLEDRELSDTLYNVNSRFDIEWYANFMDVKETKEGYENIRKSLIPYVEKIEKLIIRGSEEGAPVTDEERAEWWKIQKQREREEFYKLNGYYEDEE